MATMADVKTRGLKSVALLVLKAEDALPENGNIIYKTHILKIKELTHWFANAVTQWCICSWPSKR